jgi:hypothetical protein
MFSVTSVEQDHPLLRGRVAKYFTGEELKHEFSHTMLHNQRIDVGQNKLKDQFNNLKIVNNENVAKKPDVPAPDRGVRGQSPRNSEAGKPGIAPGRPETPKGGQGQGAGFRPQMNKPEKPVEKAVVPARIVQPAKPSPVVAIPPPPARAAQPPAPARIAQPQQQPPRAGPGDEAKQRQAAAKQAYLQRGEQLRREKDLAADARRRKELDDADRKRKDKDDDERRRNKAVQDRKAKEEAAKLREREELEKLKEEKKAKRDNGREAMMQDIARRRKEKQIVAGNPGKKPETRNHNPDLGIRNSSYCSNKSDSGSKKLLSKGLGSRNNSSERLKPSKASEERPSSRNSSAKKLPISKVNSEQKLITKPFKVELKQSDPQIKNLSKVDKPPQPAPHPKRIPAEQNAGPRGRADSGSSRQSRPSEGQRSETELPAWARCPVDDDLELDDPLLGRPPADNAGQHAPAFGKTAYFMGEPGTGAFVDFRDDILDINKASDAINNRLFGDRLPAGLDTPPKAAKPGNTNLDFITVDPPHPDQETGRGPQGRRRRPHLLPLWIRPTRNPSQPNREESRRTLP